MESSWRRNAWQYGIGNWTDNGGLYPLAHALVADLPTDPPSALTSQPTLNPNLALVLVLTGGSPFASGTMLVAKPDPGAHFPYGFDVKPDLH